MSYLSDYLPICESFEGRCNWMYQDSVGKVTTGVGLLIPTVQAAVAMPFQDLDGPASEPAITAEYYRVLAMPTGHSAAFYRGHLTLPDDFIDLCLKNVVLSRDTNMRDAFQNYDAMPDGVKMALLDMSLNLGTAGLLAKFPHFCEAVRAGNWQAAEAQCNRPQLGMPRNDWTKKQFQGAI
jgi:GH24 family phage-related lysozyme (muramidase)